MANLANLLATIAANVYTNHNNEVTAQMVKDALGAIVSTMGQGGYIYKGLATTSTNPSSPDANVFYIATAAGTYTNFGGIVVNAGEVAILKGTGTSWSKDVTGAATAAKLTELGQKVGLWKNLYKTAWAGAIAEIYIFPDYVDESADYQATSDSTGFTIGKYLSGYQWFATCKPTENHKIYDLVVFSGSPMGATIGKVVFNDYAAILGNTYGGSNNKISITYASNKSFQPNIAVYPAELAAAAVKMNTGGETFSDVKIFDALKSVADGDGVIICKQVYSNVGNGNTYNGKNVAQMSATPYLGKRIKLAVDSISSVGDTSTSCVSIRFYNGSTYVSESAVVAAGGSAFVDVPTTGIDNIRIYCYNSVASHSTSGEMYYFSVICSVSSKSFAPELPDFHLAKKIYCVAGEKNLLFTRGIVHAVNPYMWSNKFVCSATPAQVRPFPRYLQVDFSSPTTKDISLQLISNNYKRSSVQSGQIVVKSPSSPGSNINVLCFGSSTTTDGVWAGELKRRLCGSGGSPAGDNLSNISFVGRADGTTDSSVKVEGIGGWSWRKYMNGAAVKKFIVAPNSDLTLYGRYTYIDVDGGTATIWVLDYDSAAGEAICAFYDSASTKNPTATGTLVPVGGGTSVAYTSWSAIAAWTPFDDSGSFGFQTYATKYCNGSIDVIICHLSYLNENGGGEDNDMTAVMADVKAFVDQLHTDFPSCKVLITTGIGVSPFGGAGNNYGASATYTDYGLLFGEWAFQDGLEEFVADDSYKTFCFMVNSLQEVDMENAFPETTAPLNLRTSGTEKVQTNALHPTTAGSYMTADSVYRCFVCTCLN